MKTSKKPRSDCYEAEQTSCIKRVASCRTDVNDREPNEHPYNEVEPAQVRMAAYEAADNANEDRQEYVQSYGHIFLEDIIGM